MLYWNFDVDESQLFIRCKEGVLTCNKLKLFQAKKQSRGGTPKYFVKQHIKNNKYKGVLRIGKIPAFCGLKSIEELQKYKNFVDKKFQYMMEI